VSAINYAALAMENDPSSVKTTINLPAVILAYGVDLEPAGDGRLVGICPFHDEMRPSFAVWQWEDGTWACGCWSCSFHVGDVFDFLQRWHNVGFRRAVEIASRLGYSLELVDVPANARRARPDPELIRVLDSVSQDHEDLVERLLLDRGIAIPARWLTQKFRVGANAREVLIPHFDRTGVDLVAIKHRAPGDGWVSRSVQGSRLSQLYGVWRVRTPWSQIVLCEGESDTWSVSWWLREGPVDVLGLPSGATATPRANWIDDLRGRRVTLFFDADRAGREGTEKWLKALGPGTLVAHLPDGSDATSAGPEVVRRALTEAKGTEDR